MGRSFGCLFSFIAWWAYIGQIKLVKSQRKGEGKGAGGEGHK